MLAAAGSLSVDHEAMERLVWERAKAAWLGGLALGPA